MHDGYEVLHHFLLGRKLLIEHQQFAAVDLGKCRTTRNQIASDGQMGKNQRLDFKPTHRFG